MLSFEEIASIWGIDLQSHELIGLAHIELFIAKMKSGGSKFIFAIDGERDVSVFTLIIQDGLLKDNLVRYEGDELNEGIRFVLSEYIRLTSHL